MSNTDRNPTAGDPAPGFKLPASAPSGEAEITVSLADIGKPVVLFFYPKDDTSGCTREANDFTAALPEFAELGIEVIGVSPDPVKKHLKFRDKHGLGMALVSDESKNLLEAYGVWVEKSMYGKKYMGVERSTFLISADSKIMKSWRKVKVPGHVEEVLAAAKDAF